MNAWRLAPFAGLVLAVSSFAAEPEGIDLNEAREFWSFQPIKKTEPPAVKGSSWAKTPIDRFILAKLEEKGLQPVSFADNRALIRRATFDLTGLPPTPEEIDEFLKDYPFHGAFEWAFERTMHILREIKGFSGGQRRLSNEDVSPIDR